MKSLRVLLGLTVIFALLSWVTDNTNCKNSNYILSQVKAKYNANSLWESSELKLHIQEPRVGNPLRHTKLFLNNGNDYFEMERFREDGVVKRILTNEGESRIYLNEELNHSEAVIEQYQLNTERTKGHKAFYKLMYGLPMSLTDQHLEKMEPAQKAVFDGIDVYRISIELKEPMISKYWTLIVDSETYALKAIEFNHPDEPEKQEEILVFESEIEVNGFKIPRIRNWYIKGTNEYLGSDIIVEELK